jgi:Ca-activated chloride channel family protein
MQFLWSPVLWLLVLVPLLIALYVWLQTRRNKYAVRYASLSLIKPSVPSSARWRRYIPPALFFIALAIMFVALSRPVALVRTPRQEGSIILALDSSLSMRAEDMVPNRFEAARTAARSFIEKRGAGAQIGIVAFAGSAAIVQLPSTDAKELSFAINRLSMGRGTAIGEGILASMDAIAMSDMDEPAPNVIASVDAEREVLLQPVPPGTIIPHIIVLLTDGQNRNGIDPLEASAMAAERGVRVYTVGVGSREGGFMPGGGFGGGSFGGGGFGTGGRRQELDEETLQAIADETGGEYFYAANETELEKIYNNLGLNLVLKLEKLELTAWFTAAAAIMLFGAFGLSMWWSSLN